MRRSRSIAICFWGVTCASLVISAQLVEAGKPSGGVRLPAPTGVSAHWSMMFSQGEGRGRDRCCGLMKKVFWQIEADPRVVTYDLYEQQPGDSAYRLVRTIALSLLNGQLSYRTYDATDIWTGDSTEIEKNPATNKIGVHVWVWRHSSGWPIGTYRHYIVPRDAQGRAGPKSVIVAGTYVGEGQITRPNEGETVEYNLQTGARPVFEWTDPTQGVKITSKRLSSRCTYLPVWGGSWGTLPFWDTHLCSGETSVVYGSTTAQLESGQQYFVATSILVTDKPNAEACPCISLSQPVGFTVK